MEVRKLLVACCATLLTTALRTPTSLRSTINARSDETVAEIQEPKASFDWFDHWYPVNVEATMDATITHKTTLLGLDLVVWNDGDGWRCFADSCPHRLGPLSEGRVEDDGSLLCSYHGWRYDGSGAISSLPYSPPEKEERHRRGAKCESYPTLAVDGFVWVFPQPGVYGAARAAKRPPPLISELHDPETGGDWQTRVPAGVRDFPCGWDTMVENTLDPAHFCAAHHGTLGDRYADPRAYDFFMTESVTGAGFALDGDMGALEFVPPCLVKYAPDYAAMPFGGGLVLATYCVPTAPGRVRPLATVLRREGLPVGSTLAERALFAFMGPLTPAWVGHLASSVVLHQDAGLLYGQFKNLKKAGYDPTRPDSKRYSDVCFQPNAVDRGVASFRRWLVAEGGGGPAFAGDPAPAAPAADDVYDMWDAHTKHCRYCLDAYGRLEMVRGAAAAAFIGGVALPDGPERAPAVLAAAAAGLGANWIMGLFRRYEFSHADND